MVSSPVVHVFFGDEMSDEVIHQGEEIDRQASHSLTKSDINRDLQRLEMEMRDLNKLMQGLQRGSQEYSDAWLQKRELSKEIDEVVNIETNTEKK